MTPAEFLTVIPDEAGAIELCRIKNRAFAAVGNRRDLAVVVEHPDGFAVMDLHSAIDVDFVYQWYI